MIKVYTAYGFRKTGRILQRLLDEMALTREGHVSYGVAVDRGLKPCLNVNAGWSDKLAQARKLDSAGLGVKIAFQGNEVYPLIGRRRQHVGGSDINLILDREALFERRHLSDYFTVYQPSQAEYRVWVYRRQHLATYIKRLTGECVRYGFGRNYDNGWRFKLADRFHRIRPISDAACKAVDVLGLDFGAADVLLTPDNRAVVLEVNTAPGVESEDRAAIRRLARKIKRWHDLGFPRRRGDTE